MLHASFCHIGRGCSWKLSEKLFLENLTQLDTLGVIRHKLISTDPCTQPFKHSFPAPMV